MTKQKIFATNSNMDFFSDENIDQEKIIQERLNKVPNFENTNQKLFLYENNTYDIPIYPNKNHKKQSTMKNSNILALLI